MVKGILISPLRRAFTFSSSSGDAAVGSANKSPRMMAREKEFLACNFDIFSKTARKFPFTAPAMILHAEISFSASPCTDFLET